MDGLTPGAKISVIVTAHRRRHLLWEAVQSVLDQSISREDFEILVLKDWEDREFDTRLELHGVTHCRPTGQALGAWFAQGIPLTSGQVLAFLDDDDRFLPGKLSYVLHKFESNPELVYFHHASRRVSPVNGVVRGRKPAARGASQTFRPFTPGFSFDDVWKKGPAFNLSSIAVRRGLIEGDVGRLASIQVSVSAFLFYRALVSKGYIEIDSGIWTVYGTPDGTLDSRGGPPFRDAGRLSALSGPRAEDAKILLKLVESCPDPRARGPIEGALASRSLVGILEGRPGDRTDVVRALFWSLRTRGIRALVRERPLFGTAILFLIASQKARERWSHLVRSSEVSSPGE